MLYFDTSFLAPLFKPEPRSHDVEQFTDDLTPGSMGVSRWVMVELSSLVAKSVRMGSMTAMGAQNADAAFDRFVSRACSVLDVTDRDFDLARGMLSDHRSGLRAGDALHLAIASNAAAAGIYSLDRTMVAAGLSLGLPMNAGFPAAI